MGSGYPDIANQVSTWPGNEKPPPGSVRRAEVRRARPRAVQSAERDVALRAPQSVRFDGRSTPQHPLGRARAAGLGSDRGMDTS